jgi:hypothetical protein
MPYLIAGPGQRFDETADRFVAKPVGHGRALLL